MGYYSAVGFAIKESDFKKLLIEGQKNFGDEFILFNSANILKTDFGNEESVISVYIDYIKWYDSPVDAFQKNEPAFIKQFLRDTEDYIFYRAGEDTEDIEKEDVVDYYNLYDVMDITVSISPQQDDYQEVNSKAYYNMLSK